MHDAYEPVPILEKLPLQIDCLAAWGELLALYLLLLCYRNMSPPLFTCRVTETVYHYWYVWHDWQHPLNLQIMTVCLRVSPRRGLAAGRDKARASSSLQNQEGCRYDSLRSCEFGLLSVVLDIWNISFYHHLRYQPVWGDAGKIQ